MPYFVGVLHEYISGLFDHVNKPKNRIGSDFRFCLAVTTIGKTVNERRQCNQLQCMPV
jgi:hypothetical protein